ncbi:SPOR domain-containing protein [Gallaecimonas sp. GXIMD4217]|uniref:SPOR domain-containing protein n=1 Tax=Gallaecimonas sp. GXIMD4217 TaxID=3131927 RepID=UPI00311B07B7
MTAATDTVDWYSRLKYLLHYGRDPVAFVSGQREERQHLFGRLVDVLPTQCNAALIKAAKGSGVRKLRSELLAQWFSDPLFNPDDSLLDSYARMGGGSQVLAIIEVVDVLPTEFIDELLALRRWLLSQGGDCRLLMLGPASANFINACGQKGMVVLGTGAPALPSDAAAARPIKPWLMAPLVLVVMGLMLYLTYSQPPTPEAVPVPIVLSPSPKPVEAPARAAEVHPADLQAEQERTVTVEQAPEQPQPEVADPEPTAGSAISEEVGDQAAAESVAPQIVMAVDDGVVELIEPASSEGEQEVSLPEPEAPAKPAFSIAGDHYTLQLAAGTQEKGLRESMQGSGVTGWYLYEARRNGQPWYVVIYGDYPDKASARAALAALPERFRKAGAWIKSGEKVMAEIAVKPQG